MDPVAAISMLISLAQLAKKTSDQIADTYAYIKTLLGNIFIMNFLIQEFVVFSNAVPYFALYNFASYKNLCLILAMLFFSGQSRTRFFRARQWVRVNIQRQRINKNKGYLDESD